MNALINGSGNHKVNFATAILDGLVMRIGLSVLLGLVLNLEYIGFWLGDALAGFTPLWIGLVYYFSGAWKTRKYVIKEEKA
jgi:Na+-driven multidrug efflux pump